MAYLSTIIHDIEQHYSVKINGNYHIRQSIDGIRFLDQNDLHVSYLYPNILYLADFSTIYSKDLIGDILYVGCKEQIPKGSSLYISESLDLYDLHNVIEFSLQTYRQIEFNKSTLFHTLYSGQGLQGLLESAYKMIKNPIVVCDSSYSVIGSFPKVSDDECLEVRNNRLSIKSIFTDNMKESQTTERIYHSVFPFVTNVKYMDFPIIFESIRIKRAVVGYICIRCMEKKYEEKDLEIIHSLTQMISIQLQKDDKYSNPSGIKYDMFLKDLFAKQFDGEEMARKHLSYLGMEPKRYFYLIATGFTSGSSKIMATPYYREQFSSIFKNSITGLFGNRFITLVSISNKEAFFDRIHSRLETFLTMNHMLSAISYCFDQLSLASIYAKQCHSLLSDRIVAYTENSVVFYDDYYLKHLVNLTGQSSAVKASIHPSIHDMLKYDEEQGTDYVNTLKTYFQNNRSMPATAKALFIHKSTLFYRFDKMNQLFHLDVSQPDKLFAYEYSLRMLEIV